MPVSYPPFVEHLFSYSAWGVGKESAYRTPVTPTGFTPFSSNTMEFDPALFSPSSMIGTRSTHVYNLSGEEKAGGTVGAPLYSVNGIPLIIASVGSDGQAHNGVFGGIPALSSAGTPATTTSSSSFAAAGVTAITVASGTGIAVGQALQISGSTDVDADGYVGIPNVLPDVVRVVSGSGTSWVTTATKYIHTGTITVKTVGAAIDTGGAASGQATINVITGLGALFTIGDILTVDINGASTTSECVKVTGITSDALTVTTSMTGSANLAFSHLANALVYRSSLLVPFLHTVLIGNVNSFTCEKNIANVQSLVFAGSRVGKMTIDAPMGNNACKIQADIMASAIAIQDVPTSVSTDPSPPFIFKEARLHLFGTPRYEAYNASLSLDNFLKPTYTYTGSGLPTFLTATDLNITGKFDVVFDSLDDGTYGDYLNVINGTEGAFDLILQHASDASFIKFALPKVRLAKPAISPSPANVAITNLTFNARYALENANPSTIVLTVGVVGQWAPY